MHDMCQIKQYLQSEILHTAPFFFGGGGHNVQMFCELKLLLASDHLHST